jgi:hypothetical protein
MNRQSFHFFQKSLRKYRRLQLQLSKLTSSRLKRKLAILHRRLFHLNRAWKLGIATAVLVAWLHVPVMGQNFTPDFDLDTMTSRSGLKVQGIDVDGGTGYHSAVLGDVNGDGIDDFAISASRADVGGTSQAGACYVVFGGSNFQDSLNLGDLTGIDGFSLKGIDTYDAFGKPERIGDVNGDGFDDIYINVFEPVFNVGIGEGYVIFGGSSFPKETRVDTLSQAGIDFVHLRSSRVGDGFGNNASGIADINNDGFDDFIVSCEGKDLNGAMDAGVTYLIYGQANLTDSLDMSSFPTTHGVVFSGGPSNTFLGTDIHNAGDVNGDGINDLVLGAGLAPVNGINEAGKVFVVFGSQSFPDTLDVTNLNGTNGFVVEGKVA